MEFIVNQTKQIGIDADTPEEAVRKALSGEGTVVSINFSANPRQVRPTGVVTAPPVVHKSS